MSSNPILDSLLEAQQLAVIALAKDYAFTHPTYNVVNADGSNR